MLVLDDTSEAKLSNIACPFCLKVSHLQILPPDKIPLANLNLVHYKDVAPAKEEKPVSTLQDIASFLLAQRKVVDVRFDGEFLCLHLEDGTVINTVLDNVNYTGEQSNDRNF